MTLAAVVLAKFHCSYESGVNWGFRSVTIWRFECFFSEQTTEQATIPSQQQMLLTILTMQTCGRSTQLLAEMPSETTVEMQRILWLSKLII
jgi:hypothetical protein